MAGTEDWFGRSVLPGPVCAVTAYLPFFPIALSWTGLLFLGTKTSEKARKLSFLLMMAKMIGVALYNQVDLG